MANGLLIFGILLAITQHSLAADCNKALPKISPTTCCPVPELISDDSTDKCKEFLMQGPPTPTFVPMSNEIRPQQRALNLLPPAAVQSMDLICIGVSWNVPLMIRA
ncbi:hypothetical protein DOY81_012427 [Sarcophaga bullata]|nr:hypothetical protein DOY81_012427 [Sarcophaga bullata]